MFKSSNLLDWTLHAFIYQAKFEENTLLESPDLFRLGNKDVLLFSIMPLLLFYCQCKMDTI
ncbi:hypothetical protein [Bacillus sp. SA1-12]|uniref:hypothetical protein n=1 Tax=Bacillus sp. SA1-12 TaxID=1455638 RepID=UPI0018CDD307